MNEEIQRNYRNSELGLGRYNVFGRPLVGLSGITRFSRRLKIREENVAEHMWYVSYITLQICKLCKTSERITNLALEYAICHDVPEIVLDDVNHDVKQKFPALRHQLLAEEENLFKQLGKDIMLTHCGNKFVHCECNHLVAKAIVDLADVHSVAIYLQSELAMGNKYFDWLGEVKLRIREREQYLWEVLDRGSETD